VSLSLRGSWTTCTLSFRYALAFSPTDTMPPTSRAKALMLIEALASIATVVTVAGRAVDILR
jgi:hypothetical protein